MKIREIYSYENDDYSDDIWKKFSNEFVNRTDKEVVNFLFENPLYRADTPSSEWKIDFGIKEIKKDRKPKDTPQIIHNIVNNFLKKKGFEARRDNSIFCTGDIRLAKDFVTSESNRKIFVIFPEKDFYFTWNPYIKDFYLEDIFEREDLKFDIFQVDFTNLYDEYFFLYRELFYLITEKLANREENDFVKEFEDFLNSDMVFSKHSRYKVNRISDFLKNLVKRASEENRVKDYNEIQRIILNDLKHAPIEDQEKILVENPNSKILNAYTDKNFEEAILSGNEIMITNKNYFYFENKYFKDHKLDIKTEIEKIYSKVG